MSDEAKRISSVLPELLNKTSKIVFNYKKTNNYYLIELYQTYHAQFKTKLSPQQFFNILSKIDSIVVLENNPIGLSIVGEKANFDRNLCIRIMNNEKNSKKTVQESDSDSDNVSSVVVKSTIKTAPTTKRVKSDVIVKKTYDEVKEILLNSFQHGLICPISSINLAIAEIYGSSFDFKQCHCKIGSHPHGSLLKFLECCKDIVEIKRFCIVYVKRKDFDAISILEKRKRLHFLQIGSADFDYHIELLLVNLFPVKVTIEYQDLLTVFEDVYNKSLKSFFSEEPKNYLSKMNSDNIRIIHHNQRTTVTLVPSWSSEYKHFGDIETFMKVQDQCLKAFSSIASLSEKIPEKAYFDKVDSNYLKIMTDIFGEDDILELAALNLPKVVQNQDICPSSMDIYKRCEGKNGIDFKWSFFNQNLRIGEFNF